MADGRATFSTMVEESRIAVDQAVLLRYRWRF